MKTLRSILYVIVAMLLGIFINLLSLTFILKSVVQDEIITSTIKTSLVSGYLTKNIDNIDKLTDDQKKMLDKFLNDDSMNEIIDIALDNYLKYQSDSNFKISQSDVDKIKNYVVENQDFIKDVSEEDFDINEITKEITVDNIDKSAKKVVEQLDELPDEVQPIITSYKHITLGPIKLVLGGLVVVSILLLMLISWSLIKWMKATGVCLITNGVLISLLYVFVNGIKDLVFKVANLGISVKNISFNTILIIGLSELVLGIILVVVHKMVNKRTNKVETVVEEKVELPIEAAATDSATEEVKEENN